MLVPSMASITMSSRVVKDSSGHGHTGRSATRTSLRCARSSCCASSQQRQSAASGGQIKQNEQQQLQQQITYSTSQQTSSLELAAYSVHSRRQLISIATAATVAASLPVGCVFPSAVQAEDLDITITDRIYLDVGVASSAFKPAGQRTLGDKTVLPNDAEPTGRIVIGLYGKLAPVTVSNILTAIKAGSYTRSAFSRISPGEFIQLGRQGNRRMGDIEPPIGLPINSDLTIPGPFKLSHNRPGTVALSLSENDEDPNIKDDFDYRNLQFYITTGPGPVPRLDGLNPIFGRVESGMDVVGRLSQVPSFQPDIRSQQLNRFAKFLGDDRADNVRRQYGKPLKAIVVLDSGVLPNGADAALQQAGTMALKAGNTVELP